jgi:uncharacterized protein YeaO (DUF488 family)
MFHRGFDCPSRDPATGFRSIDYAELDVLAALSHQTNLSLGCYCEDENFCHRSVLRELLIERGADVV